MFALKLAKGSEDSSLSIYDIKMSVYPTTQPPKIYRFKVGTIKSIVKNFSFNFQMTELMFGSIMANNGQFYNNAINQNNSASYDAVDITVYKNIDKSAYANADGYYAINNVEVQKRINATKIGAKTLDVQSKKNEQNIDEVLKNKKLLYNIIKKGKTNQIALVYKDNPFITKQVNPDTGKTINQSVLTPLSISIVIDGFS